MTVCSPPMAVSVTIRSAVGPRCPARPTPILCSAPARPPSIRTRLTRRSCTSSLISDLLHGAERAGAGTAPAPCRRLALNSREAKSGASAAISPCMARGSSTKRPRRVYANPATAASIVRNCARCCAARRRIAKLVASATASVALGRIRVLPASPAGGGFLNADR